MSNKYISFELIIKIGVYHMLRTKILLVILLITNIITFSLLFKEVAENISLKERYERAYIYLLGEYLKCIKHKSIVEVYISKYINKSIISIPKSSTFVISVPLENYSSLLNYSKMVSELERLRMMYKRLVTGMESQEVGKEKNYRELYIELLKDYIKLLEMCIELKKSADMIYTSYKEVLRANEELVSELRHLSLELLSYESAIRNKTIFAYNEEMIKYVEFVTNGWDGTEEDFMADLYKIWSKWYNDFNYNISVEPKEELLQTSIKITQHKTMLGDKYFRGEVSEELVKIETAREIFNAKTGSCYHFSLCLASLYRAYYHIAKRSIATYCLLIGIKRSNEHHCCLLLIKEGKVAIIDWNVIASIKGKVIFVPLEVAKELHENYWRSELEYKEVWNELEHRKFKSFEEFKQWALSVSAKEK